MKRAIIYVLLIMTFTFLGIIGLINQPVDYLDFDVLDNTYYRYNIKENSYEEIKVTKDKIEYKGNSINLNNCSNYRFNKETSIIKMDCGRAFRVVGQKKEYLVLNIDNVNYYFFNDKNNTYTKEFNAYFGMTEDDFKFEIEEKLAKYKINSDLLDELIDSSDESYVFIKESECNSECLVLSYSIDKLTEENIYYINAEDLNENQTSLISSQMSESENQVIIKTGNGNIKVIEVIINNIAEDLTGYLDKTNEE